MRFSISCWHHFCVSLAGTLWIDSDFSKILNLPKCFKLWIWRNDCLVGVTFNWAWRRRGFNRDVRRRFAKGHHVTAVVRLTKVQYMLLKSGKERQLTVALSDLKSFQLYLRYPVGGFLEVSLSLWSWMLIGGQIV